MTNPKTPTVAEIAVRLQEVEKKCAEAEARLVDLATAQRELNAKLVVKQRELVQLEAKIETAKQGVEHAEERLRQRMARRE